MLTWYQRLGFGPDGTLSMTTRLQSLYTKFAPSAILREATANVTDNMAARYVSAP